MRLLQLAMAGMLTALLAVPAVAQTAQTNPATPASPSISKLPGMAPAKPPAAAASKPSPSTLVDINSASPADLDALPGIGKVRADAIIKNRPYKGKDDLLTRHVLPPHVYKGISDKIIAKQS